MSKYLQSILSVIRAIIGYCDSPQWAPIVSSVPNFQSGIETLRAKEAAINEIINQQSENIKGFTAQRRTLRTALAMISFTYLRRGMAYAKSKNETGLYESLHFPLSKLKRMNFTIIGQVMQNCYDTLSAIGISELQPFGITSFTEWQQSITAYNNFVTTPRNKKAAKKDLGTFLNSLIKDANSYMRTEIAPQADGFLLTQPLFYLGFKTNLKAIPLPVMHTRLDALVTNEVGAPCINCTVTVNQLVKDGKTYKAVSGNTDIDGTCTVREFEGGLRNVTVSGSGIETKQFGPFKFEHGKAVSKVFVCAPVFENIPEAPPTLSKKKQELNNY